VGRDGGVAGGLVQAVRADVEPSGLWLVVGDLVRVSLLDRAVGLVAATPLAARPTASVRLRPPRVVAMTDSNSRTGTRPG